MLPKLFAGLVVVAGLAASGLALSGSGGSCCYPGSDCCFPGSPCCEGDGAKLAAGTCCYHGSECCYPGSDCCDDCCFPGSPCCAPGAACCTSFVTADAAPAPRAKAGCKGCCQVAAAPAGKDDQPAKAEPKATRLVVDDMACAGCAKTVSKAVSAVAGVEAATVDLKAKSVTVTPRAGAAPSPKDLWDAVEKAGYKPTKLDGPDGTFEKKPAK
ncbi:MAG: hypothetical protein C0501_25160 [Isosphaera sp.]|nr:hypothetical protein [Isosphaera sp.]